MTHSPLNREGELTPAEQRRREFITITYQRGPVDRFNEATVLESTNGCFLQDVIETVIEQIDFLSDERPELSTPENTLTKRKLEEAWSLLELRKQQRQRSGVLGTYNPVPATNPTRLQPLSAETGPPLGNK